MRILIAIDSFKESISSSEAAKAIASGIRKAKPDAAIVIIPLADGGEGSLNALDSVVSLKKVSVDILGPSGDKIRSLLYVDIENHAYIETATSSGLTLVPANLRNPLNLSSYGTGQMIRQALEMNCSGITLFLGGTATVDGGSGLLQALGATFNYPLDRSPIYRNPIIELVDFDHSTVLSSFFSVPFTLVSDVSNMLCGKYGAAHVFGPQKGATTQQVLLLDGMLDKWSNMMYQKTGVDVGSIPGSGAAGGMPVPFMAYSKYRLVNGFQYFREAFKMDDLIARADLIITGEGIDRQTEMGKGPGEIAKLAKVSGKPVIAFCGWMKENPGCFDDIVSVNSVASSLSDSIQHASEYLEQEAEHFCKTYKK